MMDEIPYTPTPEEIEKIKELTSRERPREMPDCSEKRHPDSWRRFFDERQRRLILNCSSYTASDPAGLPGHQLMLIVSKMTDLLDDVWDDDVHGKYV